MKNWKEYYKSILRSPDDAVKMIPDGCRVLVGGSTVRPMRLMQALCDNAEHFHDVRIMHGLSHGWENYCGPEMKGHFIHESLFASKNTRAALAEGRAEYVPCFYYELPDEFTNGIIPIDVFMFQMTPPNEYGYCSCGLNADIIQEAVDAAKLVIVQMNPELPWSSSPDCLVHISRIDCAVEAASPLPVIPVPEITETERRIGEYCASLVNDGDTLQIGIGSIPDAVCRALTDKKDLGIHSEMISDGVMDLFNAGAITNLKKSTNRGVMYASFALGSQKLYDFLDNNPAVELADIKKVNHPFEVAKCASLVSINSCIEIDLMGQIVSGSYGRRIISGAGGQLDFMSGARMALDGKARSIIAITSTHTKNGKTISRIKPLITEGSSVTATREFTDYVITEYGIARLRGLSLRDRAEALIRIAHPDFRDELRAAFSSTCFSR